MSIKDNRLKIIMLTLVTAIALAGCRKDDDPADEDTISSLDNSLAEGVFQDIYTLVNDEAEKNGIDGKQLPGYSSISLKMAAGCAVVSLSNPLGEFPNTMTIDFGSGCLGYYDVNRSGKVIAVFSGPFKDAGTVVQITTDNYYVNGNKVEGMKSITNNGINLAGNIEFKVAVTYAVITLGTGETILWESDRTSEWLAGSSTVPIFDDIYSITGSANGTNRVGNNFTAIITTALRKEIACKWISEGVLEISPEGLITRKINYGDGICDNLITVTIGSYSIDLALLW